MRAIWILPLLGSLIAGLEFFDSLILQRRARLSRRPAPRWR
jgi:hypothetical protein